MSYAEVYRRRRPDADTAQLLRRWARGEVNVVTVTSGEALRNLHDMLGQLGRRWLLETDLVVASQRIAGVARELGIQSRVLVAPGAADEALCDTLIQWVRTRGQHD